MEARYTFIPSCINVHDGEMLLLYSAPPFYPEENIKQCRLLSLHIFKFIHALIHSVKITLHYLNVCNCVFGFKKMNSRYTYYSTYIFTKTHMYMSVCTCNVYVYIVALSTARELVLPFLYLSYQKLMLMIFSI